MVAEPILSVTDLHASYGSGLVLRNVSMDVHDGEVVGLLGRNGAGKTTTLRSITGVLPARQGAIEFQGTDITEQPDYEIANRGISYVPEERAMFPDLTVLENLRMGAIKDNGGIMTIDEILDWMPRLEERKEQKAANLSGGEQQMLAIGRALVSKTDLLLLDEPTEGLAPQIVQDVIETIESIKERGIPILLVEQNLNTVLEVADRVYIIDQGRIVYEGSIDELRDDETVQEQYLGVGTEMAESD